MRGHDAKSMARHLGLSVHTVNERLRDARRKLAVSSSREAARLVFETEGETPDSLTDRLLGDAEARGGMALTSEPVTGPARRRLAALVIAGVVVMSIVLGILALSALSDGAPSPAAIADASAGGQAPAAAIESDVVRSAREWLHLGDEGRWNDGWAATGESFRKLNTSERWAAVADKVRTPLGAVITRTALSQESVPAPPAGVEMVKFRTNFANKADVIETVTLVREGGAWKVVGIYLD